MLGSLIVAACDRQAGICIWDARWRQPVCSQYARACVCVAGAESDVGVVAARAWMRSWLDALRWSPRSNIASRPPGCSSWLKRILPCAEAMYGCSRVMSESLTKRSYTSSPRLVYSRPRLTAENPYLPC